MYKLSLASRLQTDKICARKKFCYSYLLAPITLKFELPNRRNKMSADSTAPPPRGLVGKVGRLDSLKNPQPRPLPLFNKKPSRAQRVAASNDCPNPDCHEKDVGEEDGQLVCRGCGTVISDSNMVSEVTFGALASGAHVLHGAHVGADQTYARTAGGARGRAGGGLDSREITEAAGKWISALFYLCLNDS